MQDLRSSKVNKSTKHRWQKFGPSFSDLASHCRGQRKSNSPLSALVVAPLLPVRISCQSSHVRYISNVESPSPKASRRTRQQDLPVSVRPTPLGADLSEISGATVTPSPIISLLLSTTLQCARCSVESLSLLGVHPSEFVERSLFDFVHPSESKRLQHLQLSLIEPFCINPRNVPEDFEIVSKFSSALLLSPAAGTMFLEDTIRIRQRSGMYDFYSVRLHLGGGFGVKLLQSDTLHRAYIVASLLRLGNDATHPEPSILMAARWDSNSDRPLLKKPFQARSKPYGGPSPSIRFSKPMVRGH